MVSNNSKIVVFVKEWASVENYRGSKVAKLLQLVDKTCLLSLEYNPQGVARQAAEI